LSAGAAARASRDAQVVASNARTRISFLRTTLLALTLLLSVVHAQGYPPSKTREPARDRALPRFVRTLRLVGAAFDTSAASGGEPSHEGYSRERHWDPCGRARGARGQAVAADLQVRSPSPQLSRNRIVLDGFSGQVHDETHEAWPPYAHSHEPIDDPPGSLSLPPRYKLSK